MLGQRDVGAIFSIIPTPEIVVAGTIVVVGGYRRDHALPRHLCLWYESWVGRLIAGGYLLAVVFATRSTDDLWQVDRLELYLEELGG